LKDQLEFVNLDKNSPRRCYISIGTGSPSDPERASARSSWRHLLNPINSITTTATKFFSPVENLANTATNPELPM
jgi:hypothetical protein